MMALVNSVKTAGDRTGWRNTGEAKIWSWREVCVCAVQALRNRRDTDPGHAAKSVRFGDAASDGSRRTSETGDAVDPTQPSFSSAGSVEFENAQVTFRAWHILRVTRGSQYLVQG